MLEQGSLLSRLPVGCCSSHAKLLGPQLVVLIAGSKMEGPLPVASDEEAHTYWRKIDIGFVDTWVDEIGIEAGVGSGYVNSPNCAN